MRTVIIFILLAALSLADAALGATFRDAVLSDRTIDGEAVFAGTVRVRGRVTVSEGSSLRIEPGTVVVFEYVDDDGDGIGESEILSQGAVRVSGTAAAPVVFRSDAGKKGAWLGFSVMNVDAENVFEHAVFEDSYMALHSHFSNIAVRNCTFRNNLRGFQSQEGVIELRDCSFTGNTTAVQFRNSKARVSRCAVEQNDGGMNFLYSTVEIEDTALRANRLFGIKARFSKADIRNFTVHGSFQNFYARAAELRLVNTRSDGAMLRGFSFESSIVSMTGGGARDNGLDGISLDSSTLTSDGILLENNGRYHLYLKGGSTISGPYRADRTRHVEHVEK